MAADRSGRLAFRVLLARDITTEAATQLAELYVPQEPYFDLCLLCGPFTHRPLVTSEDNAIAEGDMALTLAQIESIVCRVCYLASADDPLSSREKQLHLTPNSVNIHGRTMLLADNLAIGGYAHAELQEVAVDSDDEKVAEARRLRGVIPAQHRPNVHTIVVQQGGQYIPAVAECRNLCLYVCCDDDTSSAADGRARIRVQGNVVVVHPPSLRRAGRYVALGLQEEEDGWTVSFTEERELLRRPVSVATLPYTPKTRSH